MVGRADVVEFHGKAPYPVEYKHGVRRHSRAADVQLCAQGMCLDEMTGVQVPKGAIFHQGSRLRRKVVFSEPVRRQVEEAAGAVRATLASRQVPAPVNDPRCGDCSLLESCLPSVVGETARVRSLAARLFQVEES